MQPQVVTSDEDIREIACDALVVGAFTSREGPQLEGSARAIDESLDGALSEHLADADFKGKVGETAVLPTLGRTNAKSLVIAGLGPRDRVGSSEVRKAAGAVARKMSDRAIVVSALHEEAGTADAAAASAEGFLLGLYRFTSYKSEPDRAKTRRIIVPGADEDSLWRGAVYAEATARARDLINEPASTLTPAEFARRAREIADDDGLECRIYEEDELQTRGFGGLLGVAQGSAVPPRLIQLRYRPNESTGKLAIIGKGITFDSGGLSLKDAKGMETMKTDMSGGAAVIGAMSALAKLDPSVEVLALVPATENMPGGRAIKPGDVIRHYGGHTSEVLNTDAEGRLVLADALVLACEEEPDAIIDVATLTGAMVVALGQKATGFFSNDDDLAQEIADAAASSGERFWRMPLYDDYRKDLDSEVADIKNTGPRWGGAIYAALFLRDFVADGIRWAHLDIAGPARAENDYDEVTKGGTGVAVRTLLRWIEARGRKP